MRKVFNAHPRNVRIGSLQRILLAKRLSLYLRAGIPLLEALDLIQTDAQTRGQRMLLSSLIEEVRSGLPISHALTSFPRVYAAHHVQIIAVGESTGTLPDSLTYLSDLLARRAELQRTFISALAYPGLILCGTIAISGFLILYAFPKIIPIFKGLHVTLPFTTRVLLWISQLVQVHGIEILALGIVLSIFLIAGLRQDMVRSRIDPFLISAPFVGRCIQHYCLTTLFRTLYILTKSGISLDYALSLTCASTRNTAYKKSLADMEKAVLSGQKCTYHMRTRTDLYPPVALQLITAGELTGFLSESARIISDLVEDSLRQELKVLTALLEPVLMVSMGFVVGFVALAIISPMYALTQGLSIQ